jgi:hypothetical protein
MANTISVTAQPDQNHRCCLGIAIPNFFIRVGLVEEYRNPEEWLCYKKMPAGNRHSVIASISVVRMKYDNQA